MNFQIKHENILNNKKGISKLNSYKVNSSYYNYLEEINVYKKENDETCVLNNKTIYIPASSVNDNFKQQWSKTGINYFRLKPNIDKWDISDSIDLDEFKNVDNMITYLNENTIYINDDREYFEAISGKDSFEAIKMKKEMKDRYLVFYDNFHKTKCYNYLKQSHHIASQLIHYSLMNTKPRTFSFFNAGNPNILYIMAGCYNKLFSELGKPFMIIAITKNPDYYSTFFGKLKKIKLDNDMFLIISNWRRLPTIKLTHIRDGFYSVLSSTMNSAMNLVYEESYLTPKKYNHIFSLRSVIALSTNQRVAEILMDNRYAYMSSFSMYTNINKLLKEKFEPPYRTSLECWLIIRILTRLQLIFKSTHDGSILLTQPEFKSGIRIEESTGGNMKIPSLWGNYFF